jgi:hypothetical protein
MSRKIQVEIRADSSEFRKQLLLAENTVKHPARRFYPRIATAFEWWMERVSRIFKAESDGRDDS